MTTLYFICEWGEVPLARMSEIPCKGTELGSVKWRNQPITVKIISSTPVTIKKVREITPPLLYPLLKSNLQKQVRRQSLGAISTAARLWELGPFELLRRLAIIAAEDVEITVETTIITWLMVARSKGIVLTDDHRLWVLGYVHSLVNHDTCRRLEMDVNSGKVEYQSNLDPTPILLNSDHPQVDQIVGILFRTAYGGLKGDPPMLTRCLDWFLVHDESVTDINMTRWKLTDKLPKLLINRAAIDFHIWPELVEKLSTIHPHYSTDFIRKTIWECSSCTNKRQKQKCKKEFSTCWKILHKDFSQITKTYLSRILDRYPTL